ncbi:gp686 [Bacillus phage G]|uniref:Gp686 n=1 Tax=Bacillus phage G TaxID=2884420 RepID=G3MB66_9CAUD|nr:gp686 [Bacillus phage G]AEO93929.1 gp686 [Bacillus phage G]
MKNLVEKITCKKCNTIEYREIETLNNEKIQLSDKSLVAVAIKRVNCKECNSSEHNREFVEKPKENKDAI